jgi:hypothetical protein
MIWVIALSILIMSTDLSNFQLESEFPKSSIDKLTPNPATFPKIKISFFDHYNERGQSIS